MVSANPFASFDVIVVGLGAMGSAALYQLSKRGVRALGVDRFAPPHGYGSTHGDTRITRQAIGEGAAYTPLALRSYELWDEIAREAQVNDLLTITGGLILTNPGANSSVHGNAAFMENTLQSARQFNIAHETLTPNEIQARFPQFKLRGGEAGYWEEMAGFLRPERCVETQLDLAQRNGARVQTGETVLGFTENAQGSVTVTTNKGTYYAEKLIVTAGPWASDFVPVVYKERFRVYRQVLYWFDVAEWYEAFVPERFPIFIWDFGTHGDGIYGFPAIDGKDGGLKVATEQYLHATTDPMQVARDVSRDEINAMYDAFIEPRLVGVGRKCVKAVSCLYTVTTDSNFVIDAHPDYENVLVASPCSGHGFKHSAAIGEALAQWATAGKTELDLSAFSFARFST